ncbi:MAG TPA: SDR family NAD(P)-dependent oxidoreductase [Allosphingosinicella sp.]|jgi:NAD(P)-dependent dehydrogenase (short-subunit alcohol dehydrogenase family)
MGVRAVLEWVLFPRVRLSPAQVERALRGKTVLITGASFGIGEAVARIVAAAGARVVLVARTAEKLEEVAAGIRSAGGEAVTIAADLTDPVSAEGLATRIAELSPDIVVSNAGKSIRRPLFESLDRFHDVTRTIGVNYLGPTRVALAAIPALVERQGQIINVSAANVLLLPAPYWAAYQASKSAFDQWLRCAAPELRARGVAVTTVYLPLVRTRMIAPTKIYAQAPAMAPDEAARLIVKMMLKRRKWWTPWWLPPAHLASALLRRPWEAIAGWQQKRALRR